MGRKSCIGVILAVSLLANVFCYPTNILRIRRQSSDSPNGDSTTNDANDKDVNNEVNFDESSPVPFSDDDEDDFPSYPQDPPGGGSNLFSLLNLATAILPGLSNSSGATQKFLKEIVKSSKPKIIIPRHGVSNDEVDKDYILGLKPPPTLVQDIKIKDNIELENSESDSNESDDENNSAEESLENEEDRNKSDENSVDSVDDDEYDEPPGGGDGEGGGLLGLLAGLSGGEDGQSDLGSLLATISGIVANLSGDGIDLNALIASGIGLFVGLLSEGEENPGEILASYLLTSLDTITGGGAQNNGAFFGKFLSKLVKGTSAGGDPDADSDENGNNMPTKDSGGFFASFLMGLLGDMSKSSSGSHPM